MTYADANTNKGVMTIPPLFLQKVELNHHITVYKETPGLTLKPMLICYKLKMICICYRSQQLLGLLQTTLAYSIKKSQTKIW